MCLCACLPVGSDEGGPKADAGSDTVLWKLSGVNRILLRVLTPRYGKSSGGNPISLRVLTPHYGKLSGRNLILLRVLTLCYGNSSRANPIPLWVLMLRYEKLSGESHLVAGLTLLYENCCRLWVGDFSSARRVNGCCVGVIYFAAYEWGSLHLWGD